MIKTRKQMLNMRRAGRILAACHRQLSRRIRPGVSTLELNHFVEDYLGRFRALPEQKGYRGFPYAICASVNDEICHGFPDEKPLKEGDIVTIDIVVNKNGWLADSAWSYAVGHISPEAENLLRLTREALFVGIRQAVPGNRIGDIGNHIQTFAERHGLSVVREFCGHGIGRYMHEPPLIPHYGSAGEGAELKEGMVITIEPMLNMGKSSVKMDRNGWTARTRDGSLSAQYEHTVAITRDGPRILTR